MYGLDMSLQVNLVLQVWVWKIQDNRDLQDGSQDPKTRRALTAQHLLVQCGEWGGGGEWGEGGGAEEEGESVGGNQ